MIYLDNAATTMKKPDSVIEAVCFAMQNTGNAGRGAHSIALTTSSGIYMARKKLADFFGAKDPKSVCFTMNSTEALNIAIKGVLREGDHVITSVMEHNSVLRPLYELEKQGIKVTRLPFDDNYNLKIESLKEAILPNTRAIVLTHASNVTGNIIDIESVGKIARAHNLIFIVDASQTAGYLPINVEKMNIDILCFTGHKSLLGPQGTGGMVVNPDIEVRPLLSGGSGILSYSETQPDKLPERLEAGTLNSHGIAGLSAAIGYINEYGMERIREEESRLMWYFYNKVKDLPGLVTYGDFSGKMKCPIVSLNIEGIDSSEVSDFLSMEYDIATRSGAHCAPLMHKAMATVETGAVRFSFSHFNTEEEIDMAVSALKELL